MWPDKQCLGAVWWLRGGGFWNEQKPREREGNCIGLYFGRDPDQVHVCASEESGLANGRVVKVQVMQMVMPSHTRTVPWSHSAGMAGVQAGCEWPLRRRRKWSLRWRESVWPMQLGRKRQGLGGRVFCTAAPMADRPVNPRRATHAGAQSSVGVAKERVGDIMMAARAKTGQ